MAEITTVIPVFNGEKYITQTLDSLAAQTCRPDRVVVVDDRSTDRTEEIVRTYANLRCDWMPNKENLGLFPNHNSALRFCSETRFFHILHANDLILPDFFEKLIPLVDKAPGFAMAFGGHVFIRENGLETQQKGGFQGSSPRELSLREFLESQTELKSIQLHSAILKTNFQPCPVQFRTDLPQLGDVVFHSEFAAHCSKIWGHPDILCQVRIHGDSATNRNIKNMDAWVLDEWKTMQLVFQTMQRKGLGSGARARKIRLLFAARSCVKVNMMRSVDPEYAGKIRRETIKRVGYWHWLAAAAVVRLRDALAPKNNSAAERLRQESLKK